jgi:hypothetical protein
MPQLKDPASYRKNCTLCNKPRDVLVRCQIDPNTPIPAPRPAPAPSSSSPSNPDNNDSDEIPKENEDDPATTSNATKPPAPQLKPGSWHFVCPGSCWQRVSGGVIDGDLAEGRQGYRYGGMWKNKHAGASAKVPRRLKGKLGREGGGKDGTKGEKDDEGGSGGGGGGGGGVSGEGRGEYGRKGEDED